MNDINPAELPEGSILCVGCGMKCKRVHEWASHVCSMDRYNEIRHLRDDGLGRSDEWSSWSLR